MFHAPSVSSWQGSQCSLIDIDCLRLPQELLQHPFLKPSAGLGLTQEQLRAVIAQVSVQKTAYSCSIGHRMLAE